jgi:manganese oxidase
VKRISAILLLVHLLGPTNPASAEIGIARPSPPGQASSPPAVDSAAATAPLRLPIAEPNDNRTPAGRMVDGVLHLELEAVLAEWRPRGPDGPAITTPTFAEVGGPPQVPGPLLRASAGTPVRVSIRNTLDREIAIRGLFDRGAMEPSAIVRPPDAPPPGEAPHFFFADSIVVPPGETRETRFTPTAEVTSIYYGRTAPSGTGLAAPSWMPAAPSDDALEGAFLGGLLIDPRGPEPPPDERFFLVGQWASVDEPGTVTFKMFINGLSWPFTERLEYTVGDTVRWRLFNATIAAHPMHLHGFYFSVDGRGDGDADIPYDAAERQRAVTQRLPIHASIRLSWVPEEPGNWLFHCHLVRHMNPEQRFAVEGEPPNVADDHEMHHMAGMILGITVHPPSGWDHRDPAPARRIDLWTGRRPNVYDGEPELGFVVQEGAEPPAQDSTQVPGSVLVLHRGEPTEIVVHNRLERPLSVHWHGLELRSLYDGVGHWSGMPGASRPPTLPGRSSSVLITPHRAGTFMYHVHSEVGHELAQGLYGPFLVLEPGETWDQERDRFFMLGVRGAGLDAPPAVNGHAEPPAERFQRGTTYRLRFLHMSPDESKVVRLLRDDQPIDWLPIARDGADLPPHQRGAARAARRIDVGETFDVEWTPAETGAYHLEVVTEFYPASPNPPTVQRILFTVEEAHQRPRDR